MEKISDVVYEQYLNCQLIYSPSRQTNLDKWLSYIAFIFDLYFDVSKKYIKENNYINRLFNRITPVDELTAKKYQELKRSYEKMHTMAAAYAIVCILFHSICG